MAIKKSELYSSLWESCNQLRSKGGMDASQYKDYVQMNYPCQVGFTDEFKYHLTNNVSDEVQMIVSSGSRWADPDELIDENAIWGDVYDGGTEVEFTATGGSDVLSWIDVWPSL